MDIQMMILTYDDSNKIAYTILHKTPSSSKLSRACSMKARLIKYLPSYLFVYPHILGGPMFTSGLIKVFDDDVDA